MVVEYVVGWSGARIGSGASVWHLGDATGEGDMPNAADLIREFYNAVRAQVPDDVRWTFGTEARVLDDATGDLTGILPVGSIDPLNGGATSEFVNGAGALLRKSTGTIAGNRRLQGRLFLVPVAGPNFTATGDLAANIVTIFSTAAETLRAALVTNSTPLVVWSRTAGLTGEVTAFQAVARPQTLRSRNDR